MDAQFSNDPSFPLHLHQPFNTSLSDLQSNPSQPPRATTHILPPLPPQRAFTSFNNGLFEQTSRPLQPSFISTMENLNQNIQSLNRFNNNAYPQSLQQYSPTPNYLPQQLSVSNFSQNHMLDSTQGHLSDLPQMTFAPSQQAYASNTAQASLPQFSPQTSLLGQLSQLNPLHVVGSQGRRGILPSAEGRPTALSNTGTISAKPSAIPSKDADGKFPCPHCNKTYLHAKHLKRHLLRHTGDRPYMCFLCKDTFSRSDILKRHFAKCSIRRGNPTGATHLSYSNAHMRRQQALRRSPTAETNGTNGTNGMGPSQALMSNMDNTFTNTESTGLGISGYGDGQQSMSTPISRSNSTNELGNDAGLRNRRSLPGPGPSAFSGVDYSFSGEQIPSSLSTSRASTPLEYRQGGELWFNNSLTQ